MPQSDPSTLHNQYGSQIKSCDAFHSEIKELSRALGEKLAAYNGACNEAAETLRRVPKDGQPWLQEFVGRLPEPVNAVTITPAKTDMAPKDAPLPVVPYAEPKKAPR